MSGLAGSRRTGVGLRPVHYARLLDGTGTKAAWLEAISENYMDSEGRPIQVLETLRRDLPIALHGVSMSIGSVEGVRPDYLRRLKALVERVEPFIVSDHLCWTGGRDRNLHDLLPLPYTEEAARWVAGQARRVQDFLGRRLVLENVSSYLTYEESEMTEWEFLSRVARDSGCGILLDVNNVYVSAVNHGFEPRDYLDAVPAEAVVQIHLAGHTDMGGYLFDTHSRPVPRPVWELFRHAVRRLPSVPVLIEWDEDIPPFETVEAEALKAQAILEEENARPREPRAAAAALR